jgi:hypothetical protein
MLQLIAKLANIILYNSRVLAPKCKAKYLHIVSIGPNEPDLWPHVLDLEGHNLKKLLDRLILPMHRTVVAALHFMGYSRFAPFSCLVADKLLLVLLLSRCKVPPMGTRVFNGHLAIVIELDLLPQKIMGELDCCGNFAKFADTE